MQLTKKAQEMIMRRTMLNSSLRKIKRTKQGQGFLYKINLN